MEAGLLIKVVLPASLFIIMLGMGLALTINDFKLVITKPKAVLLGVIAQMVFLPLLAYLIILLFGMTGAVAMGLMILALCPGGTTSNLYTYLAKGDVALSVTLTSVVSLIAPFTVPIFIVLFLDLFLGEGQHVELPIKDTIIQLIAITIVPISIGMLINHYRPTISHKAEGFVKIFSMAFLFFIVALIVITNVHEMGNYFAQAGMAALLLNILCLAMGYGVAKLANLNESQSKAIGIEVGFQNGTLAIVIALTLLGNTEMAIAATCYSLTMFITGAGFAWLLNRNSQANETVDA